MVAILIVSSSPARADDIQTAREHYIKGSKAFDLGRYDQAVKEYEAAYDAKSDPALLYNIAQAHKLAGHSADAIRFYRVYLVRVPDAPNAGEVRAKIAELQRALEQQQKAQQMPPDQVKPLDSVSPSTEPAPVVAPPPSPTAPPIVVAPPPLPVSSTVDRRRTQKIIGISVAAVGVAALASGVGLAVVAKQDADVQSNNARHGGVFDPAQDRTGRTFGVAGPVLIGVGAALAVAGGVVAILASRRSGAARVLSAAALGAVHF
ncbi:MAG TPA: tetratricopeptide repeat protein [Polyangia bacterium]|nr:tetratricopeptide repeat protein [Polyangia bacterium]